MGGGVSGKGAAVGDRRMDMDIEDAVMERPHGFLIGGEQLWLYPLTLGKSILTGRVTEAMGIDRRALRANPFMESMRLCGGKRDGACRLIAIHTVRRKDDLFDEGFMKRRAALIGRLDRDTLAGLLVVTLTREGNVESFIKRLGIDKERQWRQRAVKAKSGASSLSFGGKSVYGTMVDTLCERYGWTMDYVVWGISLVNARMLLADMVTTVHLTDAERKRAHIPSDRTVLRADDPRQMEMIRNMRWD